MSILDREAVDGITLDKDGKGIRLLIADHLDWSNGYEHLLMLQEKINLYIVFCEGHQYNQVYKNISVKYAIFEIHFTYEPTAKDKDAENGTINIYSWMKQTAADSVEEERRRETQINFKLNACVSQEMGDVKQKQIGDYEMSFYKYGSVSANNIHESGYDIWISLEDNYFLFITIEKGRADIKELDELIIEDYLEVILEKICMNGSAPEAG